MDIRLRKFSRQWYCKAVAFVLLLAMAALFLHSVFQLGIGQVDFGIIQSQTYAGSDSFHNEITRVTNNIMAWGYAYKSEENIKKGNTITDSELYQNLYYEWRDGQYEGLASDADAASMATVQIPTAGTDLEIADTSSGSKDYLYDSEFAKFVAAHPKIVAKRRSDLIWDDLENLKQIQSYLKRVTGFEYYAKINGSVITNLDVPSQHEAASYLEGLPISLRMDSESKRFGMTGVDNATYSNEYSSSYEDRITFNDYLVVGVNAEYLSAQEKKWSQDRKLLFDKLFSMGVSMLLALVLFIYLCLVTGRYPEDDDVHLCFIDRMYSEFHILIALAVFAFDVMVIEAVSYNSTPRQMPEFLPAADVLLCASLAAVLILFLSLLRSAKAKRFLRSFISFRILQKLWNIIITFLKTILNAFYQMITGGNLMHKAVIAAIAVPIVSATWFGTPFVIALLLFLAYREVNRFNEIAEGVRRVKNGEVDYKIFVSGKGEFSELAEDINTLSSGLGGAISAEVRSERLKAELISNVSHDIKTPLTSIITYIDLLKNEQLENEKAVEYIDIIDRKAHRLKVLTSDLFEAAKASSGSINVELEKVDVGALVRQGLGEMSDKISSVNLDFRVKMGEVPMYILADGRLMWRVLENLISNAVKYALPGSRVYIDVTEDGNFIVLTMKNMSAYELNIPADELIERFKRGDESRNSEGSGLGLNIANSLTTLQNGSFKIEVDGDLFKATVFMPKYHEMDRKEEHH